MVFLINGMPVALAETKDAGKKDGLAEGVDQIRRYHRETPEMLVAPQLFEVTQLLSFFYGATWSTSRKNLFNWKDEAGSGDFENKVKAFFDRDRFLRVLHDYVIFVSKDDELTKVILRQHQTRAVEKVLDRATIRPSAAAWSGTPRAAARPTRCSPWPPSGSSESRPSKSPTVLMLVDRNELEAQLFGNIGGYGVSGTVGRQQARACRKFWPRSPRPDRLDDPQVREIPANINTRENVFVLVDEAHRTTGGDLGNYLMGALPNATYIGFTGTPIDQTRRTARARSRSSAPTTSRATSTSIPSPSPSRTARPCRSTTRWPRTTCAWTGRRWRRSSSSLAEAEGVSDIEELNAILDRAVTLKNMLKNRRPGGQGRRVRRPSTSGRTSSRWATRRSWWRWTGEACALYKQALDKYLPPEYSRGRHQPRGQERPGRPQGVHYLDEDEEKASARRSASRTSSRRSSSSPRSS